MTNQEKRKRIIAAVTVTGVILVVILVAVVIWQIVDICVLQARKERLQSEYEAIIAEIDKNGDWLENFELNEDSILYLLAIQNGWRPSR